MTRLWRWASLLKKEHLKMSEKIKKIINYVEIAIIVIFILWFVLSLHEVSVHNHLELYGVEHAYSKWNIFMVFLDLCE